MKNFKNNYRRNRYRNNGDRNFYKNDSDQKLNSDFSNNSNFRRRYPGRNIHNASKLVEKYTSLAKEALSAGDKTLSENYLQHADHFMRVIEDRNKNRIHKIPIKKIDAIPNINKSRREKIEEEMVEKIK